MTTDTNDMSNVELLVALLIDLVIWVVFIAATVAVAKFVWARFLR